MVRMGRGFGTGPIVNLLFSAAQRKLKESKTKSKIEDYAGVILLSPISSVNAIILDQYIFLNASLMN